MFTPWSPFFWWPPRHRPQRLNAGRGAGLGLWVVMGSWFITPPGYSGVGHARRQRAGHDL